MSSDGRYTLEVEGLGKVYELGETVSLKRTAQALAARATGRAQRPDPFEALSNVSFRLEPGECFAILGANGSGKSTLSTIIAGITLPTAGQLRIRGRVLPLLGIGAGFHNELTGHENVTLFGTVLGMRREEVLAAMPEILKFAEIDRQHLETPLKRFSMGMRTRLSFATALRLRADIYIFDEVLAVADDHFKAICLKEIERLVELGRTVIFISHELPLVKSICTRAMWLDHGRVRLLGPVDEVANAYERAQLAGFAG
jgi:ABC-type polysaccharide/polyol phosphate transport system ATPase subunit